MKTWGVAIALSLLACGALLYLVAVVLSDDPAMTALSRPPEPAAPRAERLEATGEEPAPESVRLPSRSAAAPAGAVVSSASGAEEPLAQRFERVEKEIVELRRAIENLVPASEVIEIEYTDPTSFAQADRYFDEGKFSSAAGGYLEFLKHHPDHPDALDMLRKARDAYRQAGYGARAVDLQKRLLEEYQVEDHYTELRTLADLEKGIKRYDDAIAHADEAARVATDTHERLVAMAYRAWYVELGHGPAAGLAANREVERFAQEMGMEEYKVSKRVQSHIERLQKIVESGDQ